MIEANNYKLGIFVVIGITLIFTSLFILGFREMFKPKVNFMTLFDESVQGLNMGAPVKYKGVPIGKVTAISIRAEDKIVRVDMEAIVNTIHFGGNNSKASDVQVAQNFRLFVEEQIKHGLRCQLKMAGITGLSYVELDYYDPSKDEVKGVKLGNEELYIPSTPSLLASLQTDFTEVLAKIAKIDFQKISNEMTGALQSINQLLKDPKIQQLISRVDTVIKNLEESTGNINKALNEEVLTKITSQLSQNLDSLNALSLEVSDEMKAAKIADTTLSFRQAANTISSSKEELTQTLVKLEATLDSITEFITSLDEDPSSLIQGKRKPKPLSSFKDKSSK